MARRSKQSKSKKLIKPVQKMDGISYSSNDQLKTNKALQMESAKFEFKII